MGSRTVESRQTVQDSGIVGELKSDAVGVPGVVFLALSGQAPLTGVAGAIPIAVALGNGPGLPAAFVAVGVVTFLFSVGFVAMGRHVVDAGAFYAYVNKGLGRTAGSASAAVALFAYCTIQSAMYGLLGMIVSALLFEHTALDAPWWVWALVTMVVVQLFGAAGVQMGAKILAILVLAEFSILLAFSLVVLANDGGQESLDFAGSFSVSAALQGAPGVALMFAFAAMFGFEATAVYGEETRQPRRTIPRATYLSVSIVTVFFAFTSWMLISAHGSSSVTTAAQAALAGGDSATDFVFAPIAAEFGGWASYVLPVLLSTSLFAGILAFHNSANRYLFALGREGLLPRRLCVLNQRHAPWAAGCAQTAIALVLIMPFCLTGKDPVLTLFSWFSGLAVLSMTLLYLLTTLAVIVFFLRERVDGRIWNTRVAPLLGLFGIGACMGLIVDNFPTLIGGDQTMAAWLALAVPVVFVLGAVTAQMPHARRAVTRR